MKLFSDRKNGFPLTTKAFFYGWVIVAACVIIQIMQLGIQYSFGVFFKPLIADFGWSRAATSGAYSLSMICGGLSAIPLGLLADRFGPAKVSVVCGFIMGLGLVLASQVRELWQLYLTIGLLLGTSLGGTLAITGGVTIRWFFKKRGMALGIVAAGNGLGTVFIPLLVARLINTFGWSQTYIITGIAAGIITIGSGLLLRRDPAAMGLKPYGTIITPLQASTGIPGSTRPAPAQGVNLRAAVRTRPFWLIGFVYFFLGICIHVTMVHLVNYATDLGIAALTAATLFSIIGIGGIIGRLVMGSVSDRIGSFNALIIACIVLAASLIWLIFSRELWMLYIFAVLFGFSYGGEVPLMPMLISRFFGLQAVMALTGAITGIARAGGALSSWLGGKIFDVSQSYLIAFILMAIIAVLTLTTALGLKKVKFKER